MSAPEPRAALVTGGARRIGAAIVARLARAGYAVAIHCHESRVQADALAARLGAQGTHAVVVTANLTDAGHVARLIPATTAAIGPLTLLVNNASLFEDDRIGSLDPARFDRNIAVNLKAPVFLAEAFAAQAPTETDASIVNLIDQRVWKLTPQYVSYTLAKAGLLAATTTLAQALAPRVRVNAVGPGPTLANQHDGPALLAREVAGTLLGRPIDPAEIAEAVLFLARARAVTGQMIAVDSGQHLAWRTPDIVE